ncbi:MAG: DNA polymerase III subunit beta, partial [Planctomycetota bacterium]
NAVIFSVESGYMMVRLIELEYPKYMRVFPSEFKWTFVADRAELQRVLARVAVVAEDNPAVRLKLEPGHMALTAWDPDKGEARSDMDVEYSGEALDIGLDNRFMLDALAALRGERVTISGVDIHRAVRVESPTDDGVTQIIMPIR